jgi:hypothetical protein
MSILDDRLDLMALIQAWGIYRDQGLWDRLATTFHADGTIKVSWFEGRFTDFITACKPGFKPVGPRGKHLIGLPHLDIQGNRAVAQTSIQILGRIQIGDAQADNICYARFLDRLEKRDGVWRIAKRVAIYEKDRLDPVVPSAAFDAFMSGTDFSAIPEPYRYLGYRLQMSGRTLCQGILCDGAPDTLAAQASAQAWLAGQ